MIQQIYNEKDLPMAELEKLGLAKDGKLGMDIEDLYAILQGRRTDMISLKDLEAGGLSFEQLDVKLSVKPNEDGKLELLLHPIYKEALVPDFLTNVEALALENGETESLVLSIPGEDDELIEVLVEFDHETNEFVVTDTDKIIVPDMVNNEKLTPEQQARYKKGKEVELSDGTAFQMKNTDKKGLVSNKSLLIVSLLMDGGISYLLLRVLGAIKGRNQEKLAGSFTEGYDAAFKKLQEQARENQKHNKITSGIAFNYKNELMFITKITDGANGRVHFRNMDKTDNEYHMSTGSFKDKLANNEIAFTKPGEAIKQTEDHSQKNQNTRGYTRSGGSR